MMTCREASRMMSQSFDRRLGLLERLGLRLHLAICHTCRVVYSQLDVLHRFGGKKLAESEEIISIQPGLTPEARERILRNVSSSELQGRQKE